MWLNRTIVGSETVTPAGMRPDGTSDCDIFPVEFPPSLVAEIRQQIISTAQVSSECVALCTQWLQVAPEDWMARLLPAARRLAAPALSGFAVGAVALGLPPPGAACGAVYLGANLELPGLPLGMTVHAEQSAVHHAWTQGATGLSAIAVTAVPCGHCRQFLWELVDSAALTVIVATEDHSSANRGGSRWTLRDLLPAAFGPADLQVGGGLMSPPTAAARGGPIGSSLDELAIAAAEASYAPYSGNLAGVAIRTTTGVTVTGRTVENAAFNPSLSPLGAALAQLALLVRKPDVGELDEVVLAERPGRCRQRPLWETALDLLAPHARRRYLELPEPG